jgi:2-oxoglutarate dehydrogenase E2 component (dihydrolipoamide succinyltransferase)
MSDNVLLPALGESVTEGTVTRWLKKVGDTVAVDEPLVEISTDKVDTEIPSPFAGVLEQILVQEDETAQVGAALAVIGSGSGSAAPVETPVAAPAVEAAPPVVEAAPVVTPVVSPPVVVAPPVVAPVVAPVAAPVVAPPVAPVVSTNHVSDAGYVTPLVRKLASESGIDLNSVAGTGVGGRIRKDDVLAAATGAINVVPAAAAAPVQLHAPPAAAAVLSPQQRRAQQAHP